MSHGVGNLRYIRVSHDHDTDTDGGKRTLRRNCAATYYTGLYSLLVVFTTVGVRIVAKVL